MADGPLRNQGQRKERSWGRRDNQKAEKKNLNHFCIQSKDQDEQIDLIDHS